MIVHQSPLYLCTYYRSESAGKPSEAKVEAFLDEIEGETLGQMLSYLSSELESSEDQQPGGSIFLF